MALESHEKKQQLMRKPCGPRKATRAELVRDSQILRCSPRPISGLMILMEVASVSGVSCD